MKFPFPKRATLVNHFLQSFRREKLVHHVQAVKKNSGTRCALTSLKEYVMCRKRVKS